MGDGDEAGETGRSVDRSAVNDRRAAGDELGQRLGEIERRLHRLEVWGSTTDARLRRIEIALPASVPAAPPPPPAPVAEETRPRRDPPEALAARPIDTGPVPAGSESVAADGGPLHPAAAPR